MQASAPCSRNVISSLRSRTVNCSPCFQVAEFQLPLSQQATTVYSRALVHAGAEPVGLLHGFDGSGPVAEFVTDLADEAHLTGHDRELASTPPAQSQTAAGSVRERAANREV